MVGKGQPPKPPEDVKKRLDIYISQNDKDAIEQARKIESPGKRFRAYVREAAMEHVKDVLKNNGNN